MDLPFIRTVTIGIPQRDKTLPERFPIGNTWEKHFREVLKESRKWARIKVIRIPDPYLNIAEKRNEIIRRTKSQWLWFIDDDTFVPVNALELLLKAKKDCISGVYWQRSEGGKTVIDYDWWKTETEPVFEIKKYGGGGCTLLNMKMLRKLPKPIVPSVFGYFGEDTLMFENIRTICPTYIHGGVVCDHYDYHKDCWYPKEGTDERRLFFSK